MPNEPEVVETEKKPEVETPREPERETKVSPEIDKIQARMEYQARQYEKSQRELRDAIQTIQSVISNGNIQPKAPSKTEDLDELDRIAQDDWKKAVRILGKEVAQEAYLEMRTKEEELRRQQSQTSILEQSKRRVLDRYPQIEDDQTEEARMYMDVISEDPNILQNPYGPEIAMYRMEAKLGKSTKSAPKSNDQVKQEAARLVRAQAGSSPQGRAPSGPSRLEPTKEQKVAAQRMGVDVNQYTKIARALEGGEMQVEG